MKKPSQSIRDLSVSSRPVIGITLDHEPGGEGAAFWARTPWYVQRENYSKALARHGAVPVFLPHEPGADGAYAAMIDGLLLTGGAFDIPPSLYGAAAQHETVTLKESRTAFELAITRKALECDMPVFGICGGEQLINVALGGTLIQHIPAEVPGAIAHEVKDRLKPAHEVTVTEGTLLHRITGKRELGVNSSHHQAVKDPAPRAIINAVAPDGVIEGIECRNYGFCLGVQWHPEYEASESDSRLFAAFVKAAAEFREERQ